MNSLSTNSSIQVIRNGHKRTLKIVSNTRLWVLVMLVSASVFSQLSNAEIKKVDKGSNYSGDHSKTYSSHGKNSNIKSLKASKPSNHYGNGWSNNHGTRSSYNRNYNNNYSNRSNYNNRSSYNNRSNYRNRSNYNNRSNVRLRQRFYNYGHRVSYLPSGFRRLRYSRYPLYYHGGNYYRSNTKGYFVVRAPIGVNVSYLPAGYSTVVIGAATYYVAHDIYYKRQGTDYVVVEPPKSRETTTVAVNENYNREWLIYPADGQSDAELERDRYQCHRWAVSQSSYDPSRSKNQRSKRDDYYRAQAACLEGRNYVVK